MYSLCCFVNGIGSRLITHFVSTQSISNLILKRIRLATVTMTQAYENAPSLISTKQSRIVLVIAGPTAVGKSAMALQIAQILEPNVKSEIIVADSVQVYRNLDIGSNKPTQFEQEQLPHHLVNIADPKTDDFNAGRFYDRALNAIDQVLERNHLPIVVGGTMMYIAWLVHGKTTAPTSTADLRETVRLQLEPFMKENDWISALNLLKTLDPDRAAQINRNDWNRLSRSLEIASSSGSTLAEFSKHGAVPSRVRKRSAGEGDRDVSHSYQSSDIYDYRCFFANAKREPLSRRIDLRCEQMIESGLLEEVGKLLQSGQLREDSSAGRAIGYRQSISYLIERHRSQCEDPSARIDTGKTPVQARGGPSADVQAFRAFVDEFSSASRQYARAQLKWFRREMIFQWVSMDGDEEMDVETRLRSNAERIARLIGLDREAYDACVSNARQDQLKLRAETYSEAKSMKKYLSQRQLILPKSNLEAKCVADAERIARSLSFTTRKPFHDFETNDEGTISDKSQ
uniref:tRNA dimethylallyltransferase n=1 Tax=Timspurckia oligopyrenoides TaxID=708627 RepID=A0A7S0ZCJ1_9RHOD|mmetsp:Transcript_12545/g.22621  ORF Transcript_12545/g.22621 Transcript_12545/m.22621 type:complete len:514 (+) Transcript_12545:53-1594(+)